MASTIVNADMTIRGNNSGMAYFDEDAKLPAVIIDKGFFRARRLDSLKDGTRIRCTFRIANEKHRFLVDYTVIDNDGNPIGGTETMDPDEEIERLEQRAKSVGSFSNGHFFTKDQQRELDIVKSFALSFGACNVLIKGESGNGKTTMCEAFAKKLEMNFLRVNCALVRDPEEWFGYREARDGSTVFEPTQFTRMVEEGNAVILLDEANRIEPWLANSLFSLLDDSRAVRVHGYDIKVGPNVIFAMTINEGYAYVGTFEMDGAFKNRAAVKMEVRSLPEAVETLVAIKAAKVEVEDAKNVVRIINRIRDAQVVTCTTRTTVTICKLIASGASLRTAFRMALSSGEDKSVTDLINSLL